MIEKLKKMQLGRRKSYLERCLKVLNLLNQYENDTTVRKHVFRKHIYPVIGCSYSTFNRMLNEPNPQKQLKQLDQEIAELESGATQKQAKILEYLNEKGDATTSDIACLFSIKKYKILYQINKLADKALILKKEHPLRDDVKLISITDEGRKELERLNLDGGKDITIYSKPTK